MNNASFTISSWADLAIIIGICSTLAAILGGVVKSRIDKKAADAQASDRIIRLVEVEADKRVEVVRTEFKLQIAEMQIDHQRQLTAMRDDFEKQVKTLRKEHDTYRCEHALTCAWRNKKTPPPAEAA